MVEGSGRGGGTELASFSHSKFQCRFWMEGGKKRGGTIVANHRGSGLTEAGRTPTSRGQDAAGGEAKEGVVLYRMKGRMGERRGG